MQREFFWSLTTRCLLELAGAIFQKPDTMQVRHCIVTNTLRFGADPRIPKRANPCKWVVSLIVAFLVDWQLLSEKPYEQMLKAQTFIVYASGLEISGLGCGKLSITHLVSGGVQSPVVPECLIVSSRVQTRTRKLEDKSEDHQVVHPHLLPSTKCINLKAAPSIRNYYPCF